MRKGFVSALKDISRKRRERKQERRATRRAKLVPLAPPPPPPSVSLSDAVERSKQRVDTARSVRAKLTAQAEYMASVLNHMMIVRRDDPESFDIEKFKACLDEARRLQEQIAEMNRVDAFAEQITGTRR